MQSHQLKVTRTAHLFTLGEQENATNREYWIICHGYAHLASSVLEKFEILNDGSRFLIAPEGLSKFYWNGFSGKVVASWMTSRNREDEINDYADYLTAVYQSFIPSDIGAAKVILFGFSQGCATLCRWIMRDTPLFHRLILWGGMLPEDLNFKSKKDYLQDKQLFAVYGDDDEFITPMRLANQKKFVDTQQLDLIIHQYAGRHVVIPSELENIAKSWL